MAPFSIILVARGIVQQKNTRISLPIRLATTPPPRRDGGDANFLKTLDEFDKILRKIASANRTNEHLQDNAVTCRFSGSERRKGMP